MVKEVCYYCESQPGTHERHSKPACKKCYETEISIISCSKQRDLTEDERAKRLKMMMFAFKVAFAEED